MNTPTHVPPISIAPLLHPLVPANHAQANSSISMEQHTQTVSASSNSTATTSAVPFDCTDPSVVVTAASSDHPNISTLGHSIDSMGVSSSPSSCILQAPPMSMSNCSIIGLPDCSPALIASNGTTPPNMFSSNNVNGGSPASPLQPKRLHVSNIPFRFRDPDLRQLFGVSIGRGCHGNRWSPSLARHPDHE